MKAVLGKRPRRAARNFLPMSAEEKLKWGDMDKLAMNKSVSIALREDVIVDLTALRVGKSRIARNKSRKLSALKVAILDSRNNHTQVKEDHIEDDPLSIQNRIEDAVQGVITESYMDYRACPELDEIVFNILKELARLQSKAKEHPPEKRYRFKKFVVGFREVQRALKRSELKGIIISTNLEPVDELIDMISQIKIECQSHEIPLIFSLSRRRMGKAVGKSMKQSLVGITNLDGVHQPWKQVVSLVESLVETRDVST
jgi:ribosomal protein L7Ae-like RNA K-turn-binding protein